MVRARLLAAACDEFCETPFHDTDTNKIAERANLSPGTFYNYFSSKIEIFIEAFEYLNRREICEITAKFQAVSVSGASAGEIVDTIFDSLLDWRRRHALIRLQCAILRRTDPRIVDVERRAQAEYIQSLTRALGKSSGSGQERDDQSLNIYILGSLVNAIVNEDFDERHRSRIVGEVKSIISAYFGGG